jgi:hypothetical protein
MVMVLSPHVQAPTRLTPSLHGLWLSLLQGKLSKPQAAKLLAETLRISREEAYDLMLEAGL